MTLSARKPSGEIAAVSVEQVPPRVLVVDDEAVLRRSVARLLVGRGMHVLVAEDGA